MNPSVSAFTSLRRALVRRRLARLDLRFRIELLVLAGVIGAFAFWQARVEFAAVAHRAGPRAVASEVLAIAIALAVVGAILAGMRHAVQLRRGAPGPAWLALPLSPAEIRAQLEWEARAHALWVSPVAPGVLAAAVGLVPWWWLPLLAAAFVALHVGAARLGCAISQRMAEALAERRLGLEPVLRVLVTGGRRAARRGHLADPLWRREPAWRALWRKDLLLSRRPTMAGRRLPVPIALAALSVLAWWIVRPPELTRFVAFALVLLSAFTFGEWLIALSGEDPFAVLRTLPVGVAEVWGARLAWAALVSVGLAGAQIVSARLLSPPAVQLFVIWTAAAAFAILVLAATYGVTLFSQAEVAQRLYGLALAVAMISSLMIPLLGWLTLLGVIIHALQRLPRWIWLEEPR